MPLRATGAVVRGCSTAVAYLTEREVDVVQLIAADCGDEEIASKLGISVGTVQTHVKAMRKKAGVQHRSGLLAVCYAAGVLLPGKLPPEWSGRGCLCLPHDALCASPRWQPLDAPATQRDLPLN